MKLSPYALLIEDTFIKNYAIAKGIWNSHIRLKKKILVQGYTVLDGHRRVAAARMLGIPLIKVHDMEVQVQGKTFKVQLPEGYIPVRGKRILKGDLYLNGRSLMNGVQEFLGVDHQDICLGRPSDYLLIVRRKPCLSGSDKLELQVTSST